MHSSRAAFLEEAGCAPDAALNRGDTRAEWPGQNGIGAGVDSDDPVRRPPRPDAAVRCRWRSSGRIRRRSAASWRSRGAAAKIEDGARLRSAQQGIDETGGPRRSRRRSSRRRYSDGRAPADLREVLGRPALGQPPRAQVENDAGRRHSRQSFLCPTPVVAHRSAGGTAAPTRPPPAPRDPPHAIDRVHPEPGCVHRVGVEPPRPLARIRHPHANPGPRGRGHQCRSEQSLQVDGQVKPAASQSPKQTGRAAEPRGSIPRPARS